MDEKFSEKENKYGEAGSLGKEANDNTKVNSASETNENSKVKSGSETNAGRGSETDNASNQSSSSNRTEYFYLGKLGKITNFRLAMFVFGGFTMIAGVNIFATSLFHILDSVEELIFSLILLGFSSIFLFAAFLPVLPLNTQIKEKIKEFIGNFIDYSVLYGSDEDENEPVENSNENEDLVSINLSDSSEENLVSINIDDSAEEKYVSINIDQSAGGNLVSKNLDESSGENQDSKKESVEELIGILRKAQESKAETPEDSVRTNESKEDTKAYIEWAYKNTEFKEQQENKLSDKELKEFVKNLDPEVIAQFALPAKNGKKEEAIKECVRLTGLGLENCKRIMDLKMYYF